MAIRRLFRSPLRGAVHEVKRFDARHDRLWSESCHDIPCAVVRDSSYLNWKYVDQPGQDFLRLELVEGDKVCGVIVLMFRPPDEVYHYYRAFLVDLVAPLSDEALMRQLVWRALHAAADRGADSLICLHTGDRMTHALRKCGFILREPGRYLLVNPGLLDEEARRIVLAAENWYVTQGDSDIDRPW
jgi:hypothetical protein